MADDGTRTIARRAVIAAGAAGAAALAAQAAGAVLGPAAVRAADGDPVAVGKDTAGTAPTWVTAQGASPALGGSSKTGDGIQGSSSGDAKSGVYGTSGHAQGYGLFGRNLVSKATGYLGGPGAGVEGTSPDGGTRGRLGMASIGAIGEHIASKNVGMLGHEEGGVGGASPAAKTVGGLGTWFGGAWGAHLDTGNEGSLGTKDYGVYGFTKDEATSGILGTKGNGVIGHNQKADTHGALGTAEAGVRAISGGALPALIVDGGVQLLRGGVVVVPKGKSSVKVTRPKLSFPEVALAVLQAYRPGVAVAATVVDKAAGSVTIYLSKKVTVDTPVAFFLFGTSGLT